MPIYSSMDLRLENKVVLVTGSTRGIGRGIAYAFLQEGARVCVTGRDQAGVAQTVKSFTDEFSTNQVEGFVGDLTDSTTIKKCIDATVSRWGQIDIAIANVGWGKAKPALQADQSEWERVFKTNFFGAMELVRLVVPVIEKSGGSIVFISSIAGLEEIGAPLPYAAAKAALTASVKGLADDLAPLKIRINAVAPGNILFSGGRWEEMIKADLALEQQVLSQVPLRRFGTPEEVAAAVVFLASEKSSFTTGACLVVDGGQTRKI